MIDEAKLQEVIEQLGIVLIDAQKSQDIDNFKSVVGTPETKDIIVKEFAPESGRIILVPLYDIHYGLKGCNEVMLDSYLQYILNTEDCYTFLGGDSCETATKTSVGLGQLEERLHGGDQRRELTDKLRPLAEAGKILGGIPGNHEMRGHQFSQENPMTEICYDLRIPYLGYSGFFNLIVNEIPYTVAVHHGNGGGGSLGSKVNASARFGNVAIADLYITGHSHTRSACDDCVIEVVNGKAVKKRRVYVIGGSLVNYFEMYPEMKLMQPSNVGLVMIGLSGETKNVSVLI